MRFIKRRKTSKRFDKAKRKGYYLSEIIIEKTDAQIRRNVTVCPKRVVRPWQFRMSISSRLTFGSELINGQILLHQWQVTIRAIFKRMNDFDAVNLNRFWIDGIPTTKGAD